jgi:serine/threonine protein kinase
MWSNHKPLQQGASELKFSGLRQMLGFCCLPYYDVLNIGSFLLAKIHHILYSYNLKHFRLLHNRFYLPHNIFLFSPQIKREISIMKLVRHPYVVRLHEAWSIKFLFFKDIMSCRTVWFVFFPLPIVLPPNSYHFMLGFSKPNKDLYNIGIHYRWWIVWQNCE